MIDRRLDGWSWIPNFHIRCTSVRTMADWRPDGNPRRSDGCINLPITELGKNLKLGRILRGVRTGCWDVQTNASWNRSFSMQWRVRTEIYVVWTNDARFVWASGRYGMSSRQMEQWTDERLDGMTRRSDGWQGSDFFDCRIFWNTFE
jgi:hypothetical protein